jgi:integrase
LTPRYRRSGCTTPGTPTRSFLLLEQGTDVAVVSERLGHSSVAVTMSLYAHAIAGRQKLAAELFGRMLAG